MTAQPLPKTNELNDEINSYGAKNRKPNDLQIRLLKNKTNSLRSKIPENLYYDMFGRIACLENDIATLNRHYQTALKLAPTDFHTQLNYLAALHNKGLYKKALVYGKTLLTDFPEHSETISWLVNCAFMACRMHEASDFLSHTNSPDNHPYYQRVIIGRTLFETSGLTDDEAECIQNLAFSVIEKNNLYFSTIATTINRGCIHYQIYVDLPIEEIFEINCQLADVLVENTENTHSDVILFEYESIDVFDECQNS